MRWSRVRTDSKKEDEDKKCFILNFYLERLVRPVIFTKMTKFEVKDHILVPKHSKISDKEKKELLEKYSISVKDIPKIMIKDSVIVDIDVKEGDIIKITRKSATTGESIFYRRVVSS